MNISSYFQNFTLFYMQYETTPYTTIAANSTHLLGFPGTALFYGRFIHKCTYGAHGNTVSAKIHNQILLKIFQRRLQLRFAFRDSKTPKYAGFVSHHKS